MTFGDSNEPVQIAQFFDRSQAELALSVLRGSGIHGHLDQPFISSLHHLSTATGIRLFVRAADAESARIALQSHPEDPHPDVP